MAASVKQLALVDRLVTEQGINGPAKERIYEILRRQDASPARGGPISVLIDGLIAQGREARAARPAGGHGRTPAAAPAAGRPNVFVSMGIPCARYFLRTEELRAQGGPDIAAALCGDNDGAFFEVREFKGTRYVRQLHGAPGGYTRSKPERDEVTAIARALQHVTPIIATQRYSTKYRRCSCCFAELTDLRSRELGLGPDCRKRFGL